MDSTTGVQMAYVKQWADALLPPARAARAPTLLPGRGHAVRGDACAVAAGLGEFDLAYLDPPYNQHRYEANYHIWETLVAWDAPEHYGVACKRTEIRDRDPAAPSTPGAPCPTPWPRWWATCAPGSSCSPTTTSRGSSLDELIEMCRVRGHVEVLAFASNRYVGARIGIHNPAGERVGRSGRLRNLEYVAGRRGARRGPPRGRALARLPGGGPGQLTGRPAARSCHCLTPLTALSTWAALPDGCAFGLPAVSGGPGTFPGRPS